ncbi:MAG: radical SAM protein [Candidatus Bruticola sp.]
MHKDQESSSSWLSPQTLISKNKAVRSKRRLELCLLIEPESASWAVLPPDYQSFWSTLPPVCTWNQALALDHPFPEAKRSQVLLEFYRRNFISANGRYYLNAERIFHRACTYPHFICFHITEACNLACRYCMADSLPGKASMPIDTFKFIIRKVLSELPNNSFTIDFHGGEPMLAFDKIEEAIKSTEEFNREAKLDKKLYYSFQTNGTLLTRENIKRLLQLPNLRIGVSLDGPREVQDRNRVFAGPDPKKGSFQKVVDNFQLAREMGLFMGVLGVIHNPHDYLKSFNFFADTLQIRDFRLNYSSYIGRSAKLLDFPLDRAEEFAECWLDMIDHAYAYAKEHDICFTISDVNNQINNLIRKERNFMCYRSPCGAGNSVFGFAIDGGIHACEEMASSGACRLGNIFDPGLNLKELIDTSPLVKELNDRNVKNIPKCSRCPYRRFCTGGCTSKALAFFGTFKRESPMCGYYQKVFEGLMWRLYEHPDMVHYLGGHELQNFDFRPFAK